MFGEPPSSRAVAWLGTTVFTIVDGRIVEDWEVMDEGDLRRQIAAPAG
jgi:predicted ester cyclase